VSANTGTTGNFHIGIYDSNQYGLPRNRVFVSASTPLSTGDTETSVTSGSGLVTLTPGYYWIASVFSSTPTMRVYNHPTNGIPSPFGSKQLTAGYNNFIMASEGDGYTLASSTTTPRFIDLIGTGVAAYCPIMQFRVL
jgi:hypothetical protein